MAWQCAKASIDADPRSPRLPRLAARFGKYAHAYCSFARPSARSSNYKLNLARQRKKKAEGRRHFPCHGIDVGKCRLPEPQAYQLLDRSLHAHVTQRPRDQLWASSTVGHQLRTSPRSCASDDDDTEQKRP